MRALLILLAGIVLLSAALVIHTILLETLWWLWLLGLAGIVLCGWGLFALRHELGGLFRQRRGEIVLFSLGVIAVLLVIGYLSTRFSLRYDLTQAGLYSLSEQTSTMLERLQKPVHVTFFHDPLMQNTVELYQLMADQTDQLTVEFHDPMLNPAQARLLGVQFAGTALMRSEDRTLQIHGSSETDIANGILRVSQGAKQTVCFLDGHGEADPFSIEAHDHVEGTPDKNHSHGLGSQYVLHERHGFAKARHGLEALNYTVTKIALSQTSAQLDECTVLVIAGPKIALLSDEIEAIQNYLANGGNAFFMLEPFIKTGLEPLLQEFGIVADNTIVIDQASHYWADISAPAVTSYNRHQVTRELPLTFYPGVRSLSPTPKRVAGTSVTPLVNSSTNSYGETNPQQADFDQETGDSTGPKTLMVISNRRPVDKDSVTVNQLGPQTDTDNKEEIKNTATARSRVAVVGDVDFATNSFFHFLGNGNLFLNTVNYLAAQENLIGIEPRTYDLPRLSVTNRHIKATFVLSVMLVPFILAIIGTVVWWKQR